MELQLFVTPSCPLSAGIVSLTYTSRQELCSALHSCSSVLTLSLISSAQPAQ